MTKFYVKVVDDHPQVYTLETLIQEYPNVSFPTTPSDTLMAKYGLLPLSFEPQPNTDIVETGPITLINGHWTQTYNGRNYTTEELRETMTLTGRQARLVLDSMNLLDTVEQLIEGLPEAQRRAVRLEWEYSNDIFRTSIWVQSMITLMDQALGGFSDTDMDALFEAGKDL